ncbi:queuine trna-ribosyltransferase domain-containing protein [Toxoplasma gondii p89]|uniref:Queuine trna-ribosyltransferase domain-containing protein n=1 Tax=Toxoplasma gondii p89 TaxID=943119 RepID=A0A086KY93_TOXGO|nr:queuine trna-ribosyltransferase domain-containing protein [Toxoplasma gondii p89]
MTPPSSSSPPPPRSSSSPHSSSVDFSVPPPPTVSRERAEALQASLRFSLLHADGRARCSIVHLPHGDVRTPIFMPVGTYGTLKGLNARLLQLIHEETLREERRSGCRGRFAGSSPPGDAPSVAVTDAEKVGKESAELPITRGANLNVSEPSKVRREDACCLSSAFPSAPVSPENRSSYLTHECLRTPRSRNSFPLIFSPAHPPPSSIPSSSPSPSSLSPSAAADAVSVEEQNASASSTAEEAAASEASRFEASPAKVLNCAAVLPPASFSPIILGNTFHLYRHIGVERMEAAGGLHRFMGWGRNLLTDSGGFQMVSLLKIIAVREEGVAFAASSLGLRRKARKQRRLDAADRRAEGEQDAPALVAGEEEKEERGEEEKEERGEEEKEERGEEEKEERGEEEKEERGEEEKEEDEGGTLLLTPEKSIHMQNAMGSDIIMQLDDVVSSTTPDPIRVEDAMLRSLRWLDRCIAAHKRPRDQALFGIVQGGLDPRMRQVCLREIKKRPLPGFAIGGVSGGEAKEDFWKTVELSTRPGVGLPENKPRYLMGVGYPLDIVVCVALGCDMFDCVYPCRTARFGTALVREQGGVLRIKQTKYKLDLRPLDATCGCYTCRNYTRAFLHASFGKMPSVSQLLTIHNLFFMQSLCLDMQRAIAAGTFPAFVRSFLLQLFPPADRDRAEKRGGKAEATGEKSDGGCEQPSLEEHKSKGQRGLKAEAKPRECGTASPFHGANGECRNLSTPPSWVRDALRAAGIGIDDLYPAPEKD